MDYKTASDVELESLLDALDREYVKLRKDADDGDMEAADALFDNNIEAESIEAELARRRIGATN
jgi:hypothetical protein